MSDNYFARLANEALDSMGTAPSGAPAQTARPAPSAARTGDSSPSVGQFVDQYLPLAQRVGERLRVAPEVLLGQWGLETGWGRSVIPGTNNLGNIKDPSGSGPRATDNMTGSRDSYRQYASDQEFGDDFAGLLTRRYAPAAGAGSNSQGFFSAMKAGGYAEDPDYVRKGVAVSNMVANYLGQRQPASDSGGPVPAGFRPGATNLVGAGAPRESAGISDYFKNLAAAAIEGLGSVGQAAGEGAAYVANKVTGKEDFEGKNLLKPAADAVRDSMSEGGKQARAESQIKGDITDLSSIELPQTAQGWGMLFTAGLGCVASSLLPFMGPAATIQRLHAAGQTAEAARAAAALRGASAAYGGAMTGGSAAEEVRSSAEKTVSGMTHEQLMSGVPAYAENFARTGDEQQARQAVVNYAARSAGLAASVFGAAGGAFNARVVEDIILKKGLSSALGKAGGGIAGRTAIGAGGGTVMETGQETGETVGQNIGENIGLGRPALQDATRNTAQAAIGGALAGGPMGAVAGAASGPPQAGQANPPAAPPDGAPAQPILPAAPNSPLSRAAAAGTDATAAAQASAPQPAGDPILDRVTQIRSAVQQGGLLDALRLPEAPVDTKQFLNDLAVASSPSTSAALREQAIERLDFALGWANQNVAAAPKAPGPMLDQLPGVTVGNERPAGPRPTIPQLQTGVDRDSRLIGQRDAATTDFERRQAEAQRQVNLEQRMRATPAAPAEAPAAQPGITAGDQYRLEAASMAGNQANRRREDEPRQIVIDRALRNVEERGGVASPQEAQIFAEAGIGRPYDRIDESLGPRPDLVLPRMEMAGPARSAGGILLDGAGTFGNADRLARGTNIAPDPRPLPDVSNVNAFGQVGATPDQNQTLLAGEQDLGTELARRRIAEGYVAPKPASGKKGATKSEERDEGPYEQVQAPRVTAQPGEGPAFLRRRRAMLEQMADAGFETIERRDDGFYLRNARTRQELKLDGAADAQLARAAIKRMVDARANAAATSPLNDRKEPSWAQIDATNWKKGDRFQLNGVGIVIENPVGSVRRSRPEAKTQWETTMKHHYGDIAGTKGADGDPVDVFIGNDPSSPKVYVVDQVNEDGSFDEHKVMMGFRSEQDARDGYLANYAPGWRGLGAIREMSQDEFQQWVKDRSATAEPASRPIDIATAVDPESAPGTTFTIRDRGQDVELTRIDESKLPERESAGRGGKGRRMSKRTASMIRMLARTVFGKKVVFFANDEAGQSVGDGFVIPSDPSTIYLREDTTISPLAVFGHELMHILRQENPAAYDAIAAVVSRRVKDAKGFRRDYYGAAEAERRGDAPLSEQKGGELEELIADLGGDQMQDGTFWKEVFDEIAKNEPAAEAKSAIARLVEFVQRLVSRLVEDIEGRPFFADRFVSDHKAIRAALKEGLAAYVKDAGLTRTSMQAEVQRAEQQVNKTEGRVKRAHTLLKKIAPANWTATTDLRDEGVPVLLRTRTSAGAYVTSATEFVDGAENTRNVGGTPPGGPINQMTIGEHHKKVVQRYREMAKLAGIRKSEARAAARAQTEMPEFRRWFGDSKVVDAEGKPLVVYHGTQYSFNAFDPGMQGDTVYSEDVGFFFTNDPSEANAYATLDWDRESPRPNVMPVYLSIRSPKIVTLENDQSPYDNPAVWYDNEGRDAAKDAEDAGQDGLIVIDNRDDMRLPNGEKPTLFVAFRPTQIKSAIGNRGTFDPTDPDIRRTSNRDHAEALRKTGFWGRAGAGAIVVSRDTGRVLLPLRSSSVQEPNTWGTWGGAIDPDEDPKQAALRELREEAGISGEIEMVPAYVFQKGEFKYHNFVAVVSGEPTPTLNWETARAEWRNLREMPVNMHPGLRAALDDADSIKKLKEVADAAPLKDGMSPKVGIHFSTQPRTTLEGAYHGSGLKGSEAERLRNTTDSRLKSRVYFYIDEGRGVRPEAGVGGYAHEVQLPSLYDAKADPLRLWNSGDLNNTESAILDAGFDGYYVKQHETGQGLAVVIGKASSGMPATRIANPNIQGPAVAAPPASVSRGLMSREMREINVSAIPGARMRAGILTIPPESAQEANAELERIGSTIRFSRNRLNTPAEEYKAVEEQYRGTDQWLKAPNGARTRLTERQWVQVRTPSFKSWFGDWESFAGQPGGVWNDDQKAVSKAVDENGEPMVVYHGSSKGGFMTFREPGGTRRGDLGIFLAKDEGMAASYVRRTRAKRVTEPAPADEQTGWRYVDKDTGRALFTMRLGDSPEGVAEREAANNARAEPMFGEDPREGDQPGIYALFVNIRDPNEADFEGANWDGSRTGLWMVRDENGEPVYSEDGQAYFDRDAAFALAAREGGDVVPAEDHYETTDSVVREARRTGQDGAIIRNVVDNGGGAGDFYDPSDVFVAFGANQVKSADFNDGSYSLSDDDIRRTESREQKRVGDVSLHNLVAQRGSRTVAARVVLSPDERAAIKQAAEVADMSEREVEAQVRATKAAHPASDGWAPVVFLGAKVEKDPDGEPTVSLNYQSVPYGFNTGPGGKALKPATKEYSEAVRRVAENMVGDVRKVYERAKAGDKAAKNIIAQAAWYKAMRTRLRQEFGGLGDLFADLLGATSPNTPVRGNWDNAVDSLRRAMRGDFDELMPKWVAWAENVDRIESRFSDFFNAMLEQGMSKKAIKELGEYKWLAERASEARELPEELLPKKESGRNYGFNGRNVVRAMVDLWRVVKDADPDINRGGTAPKALNFSGNLIGFRGRATIDVWAARNLQRNAGKPRIASATETGVSGSMLRTGETTLQFGFGQDVFTAATGMIRGDAEMSKDEVLSRINDDDLQALVWFVEKEIWTKNNWTSAAGEGGSFEFESDLAGVADQARVRELRRIADGSVSATAEEKREAQDRIYEIADELQTYLDAVDAMKAVDSAKKALGKAKTDAMRARTKEALDEAIKQLDVASKKLPASRRKAKQIAAHIQGLRREATRLANVFKRLLPDELRAKREGAIRDLAKLARTVDRYLLGLSIERSADLQGEKRKPTDQEQAAAAAEVHAAAYSGNNNPLVLAAKVFSTEGRYGDPERALDGEFVARDGFDPRPLAAKVFEVADREGQDSAFVARVLRADEEPNLLQHRPGVEIYFRDSADAERVEQMMRRIQRTAVPKADAQADADRRGRFFRIGGFTVIVDGRRTAEALSGAMPKAVGMRILALPEYSARYGDTSWQGLSDEELLGKMKVLEDDLDALVNRVTSKVSGASFGGVFYYEVDARFRDEYKGSIDGYSTGNAAGSPGQGGGQVWQGRSVRDAVEAAVGGSRAEPAQQEREVPDLDGRAPGGAAEEGLTPVVARSADRDTSEIESIFDGLAKRGLARKRAQDALESRPDAAIIDYVEKNFLDLLERLEESGKVAINCE